MTKWQETILEALLFKQAILVVRNTVFCKVSLPTDVSKDKYQDWKRHKEEAYALRVHNHGQIDKIVMLD